MNISCSECRPQLGEVLNSEITGDNSVAEDVRAHIAACAECRRDLALMREARDEMRSFPAISNAPDLRAGIRAQLSAAPSTPVVPIAAATAAPAKLDIAAPSKAIHSFNYQDTPRRFRSNKDRLIDFLQRPSNIAWGSGLALGAFCLLLMAKPERQLLILQPREPEISQSQEYYGEDYRDSSGNPAAKTAPANRNRAKATTKTPPKTAAPKPASPGQPGATVFPPSSGASGIFADGTNTGATSANGEAPLLESLPAVAPPRTSQKFGAPGGKTSSKASATSGNANSGNAERAENSAASSVDNNSSANNSAASPALSQLPPVRLPRKTERENGGFRAAPTFPPAAARNQVREPSGNFAMRAVPSADSASSAAGIMSENSGGSSNSAASDSVSGQKNRAMTKSAIPRASTPVSRQVVARISAPRDVNWGQVSVVLPEGVRFSDGSRARVVWRGAIGAGEKIEVPISVEAASGSHAIRVSLQEVVKGDAQTIARDSVSVSGR